MLGSRKGSQPAIFDRCQCVATSVALSSPNPKVSGSLSGPGCWLDSLYGLEKEQGHILDQASETRLRG